MVTVTCSVCGAVVNEPPNLPEAERKQCPACGSVSRAYNVLVTDSVTAHDGLRLKARHGPTGKPFLEAKVGEEVFRKNGKWVNRSVRVDRDRNEYSEIVEDKDTKEIVHQCDEPLSEHIGHGTARNKKPKNV